ncbi:MAG: PD-(D/E)XK nuclease family protein [Hyphomicrobiales bacterium]|nr:PD-(D/E)XK nuclease family protein [Hyphomicrobiales bacterium]
MRRTIVVHTKFAGHMARVEAARSSAHGVQVVSMGQLAARLAGGFLAPIDLDCLRDAVRGALLEIDLGEIDNIKALPGMVRAAVGTLDKVWRADINLSSTSIPRLRALAALEEEVLRRLPPSMRKPRELVDIACSRLAHAPAVLGSIEIHGHSEMPICWRPLLTALADVVSVTWIAGPRSVPDWVENKRIIIQRTKPNVAIPELYSCATPQHEVLEAFRWLRALIAEGRARPADIAISAASPDDFDEHVLAISQDSNLPIHFVCGIKALSTPDGQTAAALAEILIKGISQERVRRLFRRLNGSVSLADLPQDWTRILPADAPLTTIERWEKVFAQTRAEDWPDGIDRSGFVLDILRLLDNGPEAAVEAGDKLLSKLPRKLWQRALEEGPPVALSVTLTRLRIDDGLEPASHPIWTSAISLAAAPRPFVRLLALNSGRWPRRISEDRLIPDHIIAIKDLDPLPIADGDRRDFATIIASAKQATISFSRRDVEGRLLGRSPLIGGLKEVYYSRGRVPDHAASESDRLLARPSEFRNTPIAKSSLATWQDWFSPEITPHDGLVGGVHPRLQKVFKQPLSATSLKLLLRDPIRFVWRYALGWRHLEESDEPLTLDALAFGNLVHEILQAAVSTLEVNGGFGMAKPEEIIKAVGDAVAATAGHWEREQPVPPPIIWHNTLEMTQEVAARALTYPLEPLPRQNSWTEIPFGMSDQKGRDKLPWDPTRSVEIPNTGIFIQGQIDRLDLSDDALRARVIDYKTGQLNPKMASVVVNGGSELQRCLYAFAVRTLLGQGVNVEPALLYPRAPNNEQAHFPLNDVQSALDLLADAIAIARANVEKGLALPGIDAADKYNDFAFALPANASYLARKRAGIERHMGEATKIWEAP